MTSRLFIFTIFMMATISTHGASITLIKNNKVLIDIAPDELQPGDEVYAMSAEGKKRAVVKITQIKGKKAIGEITKGSPEVGQGIQTKSSNGTMSRDVRESDLGDSGSSKNSAYYKRLGKKFNGASWGMMAEMIQMNMTASFNANAGSSKRAVEAAMKGSSFGVLGFYDYPLAKQFQLRGYGGLEQLTASGTIDNPDCDSGKSATCTFAVTYLSMYGAAKYNFIDRGATRFYAEAGYGFLIAASKDSNVISTSQISTNQVLFVGLGAEIPMSRTTYIPIAIDYGMFPASDTVKANLLTIRTGYAWPL